MWTLPLTGTLIQALQLDPSKPGACMEQPKVGQIYYCGSSIVCTLGLQVPTPFNLAFYIRL